VSGLLSNIATFLLAFFLTLFSAYYFLKDGQKFQQILIDISPIDNNQERILFTKVTKAVHGVVKGQFVTALVQGVVATCGYVIFGVPDPLLWGLFTTIAALVPTVGTSLATIPAVLVLLLTGHIGQAIGLAIWGACAVGLIDNIIGPRVLGHTTQVHPLLMLIAVLGGVVAFGFLGFLLGPILMAVFVAVVEMYRTEFQSYLDT
jgi:predicted PurR-regulated permease PerM